MSQIAVSHLSKPSGESSMIVPTLHENCFLQPLHFHMRRVEMKECSALPHRGQVMPFGQRIGIMKFRQLSGSAKNRIASTRVCWRVGFGLVFSMPEFYSPQAG